MGGEQVKVNLARLDQVIGELAGFDNEIEQQIATLEGRVAALHTRWEGEAAAKHGEAASGAACVPVVQAKPTAR
ncbi:MULTISPECIES: WXG100 family type VII secretion target [Mycobacteroides]|uniref:WXG100 family type VII secretion target n=1 Tax=Mycobacteroides TaxID=670516 RepID=UPI000AB84AD5|nr:MULTISPECIES: WXG100 family type VII secretion target [Mycobacteroides]MBF9351919.1 hypothetical protein [Mycobacteroides chelonae]